MNKKRIVLMAVILSVVLIAGTVYVLSAPSASQKGILDLETNYGDSGVITSVYFDYSKDIILVNFSEPMHTTTFGMGLNFAKTWTKTWSANNTLLTISDIDLTADELPTLIIYLMQTEADKKDISEPNIFVGRGEETINTAFVSITGPASVVSGPGTTTATYTISAEYMPAVSGIELEFEVDGSYLSSKDYTALSGFSFLGEGNFDTPIYWKYSGDTWTGKVTLIDLDYTGISGPTDLLKMDFNVSEGKLGDTVVKLNYVKVSHGEGDPIVVRILDGEVVTTFEQYYLPWDVNKDGVIDLNDITFALQYLLAAEGDANWEQARAADVNDDKVVDSRDLSLILANYTVPYYQ